MKRVFVLKASTVITAPKFSMRNIAGSSGRLDVVCRWLLNAFRVDGQIRSDTIFYAVLEGPPNPSKLIKVEGDKLKSFPSSEIEVARIIRDLLAMDRGEHPLAKGFSVSKMDFRKLILKLKADSTNELVYLHERGRDILDFKFNFKRNYVFILGDHIGLDGASERFLASLKIPRISLGPTIYLSSQCIVIVHEFLDNIFGFRNSNDNDSIFLS